ncbi:MAG: T9SS type A sorting domain-containing protein [Tannerella sp.]|jgi:hypothetical protein|nr:T9SS type A sorting domain-containing protein [Tannerella sp.]
MKTYNVFMMIAVLILSVNSYGQNGLQKETTSLAEFSKNELFEKQDKGILIENGLFFTKSNYEEPTSKNSSSLESAKKQLSKTFEMEIERSGIYYFAAHILPANNVEKLAKNLSAEKIEKDNRIEILDVRVYLNNKFIGTLNQTKLDWELVSLKEVKTVHLQAGNNIIRFESDAPYYPIVDAVRITESEKSLMTQNKEYDNFIAYLKSNPKRTLPSEKESQDDIDRSARESIDADNTLSTRSAMFPHSSHWQMIPHVFPNPEGIISHRSNVPIVYTYYRLLNLSAGSYTFNTAPISGDTYYSVDPVMYLYKTDDPHNYSWSNDDDTGYGNHSRISVSNIPAGNYYLVIRAYNGSYASSTLGRQGLVNVYQNGSILNSGVPVSGFMFDVSHHTANRDALNYFTAYTTGIPAIWLLQNVSANNHQMKFKGGPYFYTNPMDFQWFDDARIQLNKPGSETFSMLISAEGAMSFYFGNCDAYGNVPTGKPKSSVDPILFPNLKIADAMISAPVKIEYNCHAWSGGIHTGWIQQMGYGISYLNGSGNVWSSWDNYFGNNPSRYVGATTYTRNQAHAGNGEIALWSHNSYIADASHTSVRLLANNNPHGYDWESKCGQNVRVFHPRNALTGPNTTPGFGYGNIIAYYRDANKNPDEISMYSTPANPDNSERMNAIALRHARSNSLTPTFTMAESIEKGLTVIENVELDANQMDLITSNAVKTRSASTLETLYNNWKEKIHSPELSIHSNPYKYIETDEGLRLMEYGKKNMEECIIFFAQIVFGDDEATSEKYITEYLFCEIVKDKYAPVIEKIKEEWSGNSYDKSGRYIAPMPETFVKKYIKELLNKVILRRGETSNPTTNAIDNDNIATISPNPVSDNSTIKLHLKATAMVSIRVYSQNSSLVETILNNRVLDAGAHSFSLNGNALGNGLYICVIDIDGIIYSRKFLKR